MECDAVGTEQLRLWLGFSLFAYDSRGMLGVVPPLTVTHTVQLC